MVEGDGCKWDNAETEPLLPREEKDEDYQQSIQDQEEKIIKTYH